MIDLVVLGFRRCGPTLPGVIITINTVYIYFAITHQSFHLGVSDLRVQIDPDLERPQRERDV